MEIKFAKQITFGDVPRGEVFCYRSDYYIKAYEEHLGTSNPKEFSVTSVNISTGEIQDFKDETVVIPVIDARMRLPGVIPIIDPCM